MRSLLGFALVFVAALPALADDWPGFRGPDGTGHSKEKGLLKKWPEAGPKQTWKTDQAGIGYAGLSVVKGVLYTMGAFENDEYALAFDVKGGKAKQLWKAKIGPIHDWNANQWSRGPNATPTVDGDLVYCLSSKGTLLCVDAKGAEKWKKDLLEDFGADVHDVGGGIPRLGWGFSWSPVVDGDQLILSLGGKKGLVAGFDKKTGVEKWRSKDVPYSATYATGTVAMIGGVRQFVYVHQQGIVGVSTKDGALLWEWKRDEPHDDVVCATPLVKDDLVYYSVGYGWGQHALKVTKAGNKFAAKTLYENKEMGNRQSNVVLLDKHVYGYNEDKLWKCVELETGKVVWPTKAARPLIKAGATIAADGHLYTLDEAGKVCLLPASPKTPIGTAISSFPLPDKSKAKKSRGGIWTYPALSDGVLYVRDQELIFGFEVK